MNKSKERKSNILISDHSSQKLQESNDEKEIKIGPKGLSRSQKINNNDGVTLVARKTDINKEINEIIEIFSTLNQVLHNKSENNKFEGYGKKAEKKVINNHSNKII